MGSAFRRSLLDLQSADTEAGGAPFQDAFTIFLLKVGRCVGKPGAHRSI
jgi:hypothetical protein